MITMSFDLSSTCIGITFAQVEGHRIKYAQTLPVIPEAPSAKECGYTTKKPKIIHYRGNKFKGLLKPKEHYITKGEAERRVAAFKSYEHRELLKNIGKQCGYLLEKVKPDVVSIEKNESYNGVLTTKLLAEIAGGIYFYAGAKGIPLFDYHVSTVRAQIRRDIKDFDRYREDGGVMALDTKWEIYCRLRSYFGTNYPGLIDFEKITMDESDSLAVFYYWFTQEHQSAERG